MRVNITSITLGPGFGASNKTVGRDCDEITIDNGVAYVRTGTKVQAFFNCSTALGEVVPEDPAVPLDNEEKSDDQSVKPKEPKPASKR